MNIYIYIHTYIHTHWDPWVQSLGWEGIYRFPFPWGQLVETYGVSLVVSYFPDCGCGMFVSMHLKEGFPHTDIIVWFQCRKTFT